MKNLSAVTPFSSAAFFYFPTLSHPPPVFHTSLILSLGFGGWDSEGCQEEFLGFRGNGISLWML